MHRNSTSEAYEQCPHALGKLDRILTTIKKTMSLKGLRVVEDVEYKRTLGAGGRCVQHKVLKRERKKGIFLNESTRPHAQCTGG